MPYLSTTSAGGIGLLRAARAHQFAVLAVLLFDNFKKISLFINAKLKMSRMSRVTWCDIGHEIIPDCFSRGSFGACLYRSGGLCGAVGWGVKALLRYAPMPPLCGVGAVCLVAARRFVSWCVGGLSLLPLFAPFGVFSLF